jgi:hypothetical protein
MAEQAEIQVQDQFGAWKHFQTVSNTPTSIKLALSMALKSPIGKKSKRARAIDAKTKSLIDLVSG